MNRKTSLIRFAAVALVVLPLYELSIGPAFRWVFLTDSGLEAFTVVWAPIMWLSDRSEAVKNAVNACCDLWVDAK